MGFVKGNPEFDFFEQNPEIKYFSEFSDIVKDENGSKIMWSLYMSEDPDSKLFRMPKDQRISEIIDNYYPEYIHNEELSKKYANLVLNKEQQLYKIHIEKLEDLTTYLKQLEVDKDQDFDKYIKIIDKLPKAWEALEKIKSKMIDKENKSTVRGGAQQSLREKR